MSLVGVPANRYTELCGSTITVGATNSTIKACKWGYPGLDQQAPVGISCYNTLVTLAAQIVDQNLVSSQTNILDARQFEIWNQRIEIQMMNMANADADIQAYKIVARQDLPDAGSTRDPIATLGQAYAAAGLYPAITGSGNGGLVDDNLSLFEGPDFLKVWKIVKVKKFLLKPGRTKKLYLSRKRKQQISVMRLNRWTDESQTIATSSRVLSQMKGMTMWLFKIAGTLGRASATATPGFTTPEVIITAEYNLQWSSFAVRQRTVNIALNGIGSGAVNVREPYDMDYKTNTIA